MITACAKQANKPLGVDHSQTDKALIQALVNRGTDANKIHWVSFLIDCKDKGLVTSIADKADSLGYEADYVSYSKQRMSWSTTVSKEMKLNAAEIARHRAQLSPFVPSGACYPIGFGAAVVK
nr:ribonuclease E inhibitor RraB [Thalassotalea sp. G2M2-11]